jgi:PKHD-type hydroxylase
VTTSKEKEVALRPDSPTAARCLNEVLVENPKTWPDPCHHETSEAIFTPEECSKIIRIGSSLSASRASVVGTDRGKKTRPWVRNARVVHLEHDERTNWIFHGILAAIATANSTHWHYKLKPIKQLEFTEYRRGGHYIWHADLGPGQNITRKLSFSVQLSAPTTYTGGKLQFLHGYSRRSASCGLGSITIFPSFMLHRVKPVLLGKRYALVGWVHGVAPLT